MPLAFSGHPERLLPQLDLPVDFLNVPFLCHLIAPENTGVLRNLIVISIIEDGSVHAC
jgi:hypothetical protein